MTKTALALVAAMALAAATPALATSVTDIRAGASAVTAVDAATDTRCLTLERQWNGPILTTTLRSACKAPVAVREIVAI